MEGEKEGTASSTHDTRRATGKKHRALGSSGSVKDKEERRKKKRKKKRKREVDGEEEEEDKEREKRRREEERAEGVMDLARAFYEFTGESVEAAGIVVGGKIRKRSRFTVRAHHLVGLGTAQVLALLRASKKGRNMLITGPAGHGKSRIVEVLSECVPHLAITAPTGKAADNISGETLDSWCGHFPGLSHRDHCTRVENEGLGIKPRLVHPDLVLVIDEVSMFKSLRWLDKILKFARRSSLPWGGVQVLMFGDFCQLPPVKGRGQMLFDTAEFSSGIDEVVLLDVNYRIVDPEEQRILAEIRTHTAGLLSREAATALLNRVIDEPEIPERGTLYVRPKREDVNRMNSMAASSDKHVRLLPMKAEIVHSGPWPKGEPLRSARHAATRGVCCSVRNAAWAC